MPVAPIVGKLRKRLITDLSIGYGPFRHASCMSGLIIDTYADSVWVSLADTSSVKKRDDFYLKYEANKA
ncbi:hypothetical protein JCM24511_05257 [Saitozyma sp. JCM 24511]|nr:hypothetical protein JCM24511_05257 [Saitozyma sp. JCM 24511]